MISDLLTHLQIVLTGSNRVKVNPIICIVFMAVLSPIILLAPGFIVTMIVFSLTIIILLLHGLRTMLSLLLSALVFIVPFIVSAILIQVIINGYYGYDVLLVSSIRILGLVLLSAMVVSIIDQIRLIRSLSSFSRNLALLAILTVKIVEVLLVDLDELYLIYNKNLKCSRFCRLKNLLKALTYASLLDTLSVIEAFYTRSNLLLPKRTRK